MRGTRTARALRRNATDAERALWRLLRNRSLGHAKFRRQHPVGPFIADFACLAPPLIVEADGGQHCDNLADTRRTAWLQQRGWVVMRVWNDEILRNPEGVCAAILDALEARPSPFHR